MTRLGVCRSDLNLHPFSIGLIDTPECISKTFLQTFYCHSCLLRISNYCKEWSYFYHQLFCAYLLAFKYELINEYIIIWNIILILQHSLCEPWTTYIRTGEHNAIFKFKSAKVSGITKACLIIYHNLCNLMTKHMFWIIWTSIFSIVIPKCMLCLVRLLRECEVLSTICIKKNMSLECS